MPSAPSSLWRALQSIWLALALSLVLTPATTAQATSLGAVARTLRAERASASAAAAPRGDYLLHVRAARSASTRLGEVGGPQAQAPHVVLSFPESERRGPTGGGSQGALLGGGMEAARQYIANGKVEDWGRVGSAAAGGAVAGAITAAVPAAGFAAVMGMGAVSGAASGTAERLIQSGGKSAGSLTDVIIDAGIGAATAGAVKGGSAVVKKVVQKAAPKAARALAKIRSLDSEEAFKKQYKELGENARKAAPCNCFAAGTLVWTVEGLRPIEELRIGDEVLSWDEVTGEIAIKRLTETFKTPQRPLIDLVAQGETGSELISATPGHPFWVEQLGWVHAGDLTQQDVLRSVGVELAAKVLARSPRTERGPPSSFVPLHVAPSDTSAAPRVGTVYNITVAEFHTYFVGRAGVLVHNASPCGVVSHPSEKAARRAALREAGIPAGTPRSSSVASKPGSQAPSGPRGSRSEWTPASDANVGVHHDPHGHLFPDGSTIKPHYGVDVPNQGTVHHTYPSGHDPSLNR